MRILGIDFGMSKTGLAIAEEGGLVTPLAVIHSKKTDRLIDEISAVIKSHQIQKIVIGLPDGKIAREVKKFAEELSKETGIPSEFQDETLTTQVALDRMILLGKSRKVKKEKEDAYAAAITLQEYIERQTDV